MINEKMVIEYASEDEINPAEYNPRHMSDSEREKLRKGLNEFGLVEPLVVNHDGTLIGGHQRLSIMLEEGWTEFPIVRVDLDKSREKALNLALNKIRGEWDYNKLSAMLQEFEGFEDFDIELTGFDEFESGELMGLGSVDPSSMFGTEDGFSGGVLDPTGGKDEKVSTKGSILKFATYEVPLTEDEVEDLKAALQLYLEENGSLYGFVKSYLGEKAHV